MRLQPGTSLQGGRYRIIDVLGQGGFGITYLAEQVMAERKVCIKEFFPKEYYNRDANLRSISLGSQGSAEIMERYKAKFVKEAQTIAHLDHPNIIHILDVFEENNTCYYAMDYIEGESLSERVKRDGAMSERDAVAYIKQVASALAHIHEQQIMHLDVKPGNIMVRSKDDHAILIDFGLSKHYDATSGEATSTTPVGVSHGYAPMEQYKQGGVNRFSPETDIYSLGATLYYLVTGNVPPQAADIPEEGIAFPTDMSSNLRETIAKSMSYLRKDRPHTIKEFLALLDNDEPIVAVIVDEEEKTKIAPHTPSSKRESNEDKPKQKKHRWWLLLLIVLLIGGVAYLMFMGGDNAAPISNTTNTAKPQLDTFEQIDSDSITLYQPCQDSTNMDTRDDATTKDELELIKRQFINNRYLTDNDYYEYEKELRKKVAKIEQLKEAARQAEQQPALTEVAAPVKVPETSAPYKVGDYYNENGKEGVVFEVWDNGRHGKIVSLDETQTQWDSRVELNDGFDDFINGTKTGADSFINGTKTGANSFSDGKANTDKVMSRADSQYFKAFVWCRNKGDDWYLPAYDELKAIYNNKSKINSTLAKYGTELYHSDHFDCYWSSTEYEADPEFCAWYVALYGGDPYGSNKGNGCRVRAVSAF